MDNRNNSDFSQQKEKIGKIFIGAFDYCLNLMNGGQFHSGTSDDAINQQSDNHGQKMFEFMLQTYRQIRETNIVNDSSVNESSFMSQLKIANEFFDLNKSNPLKRSGINSESKTFETNTSLDSTTSSTTSSTFVYKESELAKDVLGENWNNSSTNKRKKHCCDVTGQSSDLGIHSSNSSHDNGEQSSFKIDVRDDLNEESKVINKNLKTISFESPTHSATSSIKTNLSETASNNSADEFDESNELDKSDSIFPKKRSRRKKSVFISSKVKKSIAVSLALKHPNWKLKKIAEHSGYTSIRSYDVLRQWAAEIEKESETIFEMTESTENPPSDGSRSMSQDLNYGLEEVQHSILPDKYFREPTGNDEPFISIQEINNKNRCIILPEEDHRDPLGEDIEPPVKGVKISPHTSDRTSIMLSCIKNENTLT